MKAKFIRSGLVCTDPDTFADQVEPHPDQVGVFVWKLGGILDHPGAFHQVGLGNAVPFDDECKAAANMTEAQMEMAQLKQDMVGKGIHPDDYDDYLAGNFTHYGPDGEKIASPEVAEEQANKAAEDWMKGKP